jgi:hypothetical protein
LIKKKKKTSNVGFFNLNYEFNYLLNIIRFAYISSKYSKKKRKKISLLINNKNRAFYFGENIQTRQHDNNAIFLNKACDGRS